MRNNPPSQSGIFTPRALFAFSLCSIGILLALFSLSANPSSALSERGVTAEPRSNSQQLAPASGQWSVVPSPNVNDAPSSNYLYGVACVSSADCWAVGFYYPYNSPGQTLIEHWNGTAWSIVPSPNTGAAQDDYLKAVTCTSSSDCWAVGYHDKNASNDYTYQTLVEHWDGTSWFLVPSPNTSPTQTNSLYSVSCTSASDCWTVGSYLNTGGHTQTLTEHWDGGSWTIVNSPNVSTTQDNELEGISCVSASDCWAVGYAQLRQRHGTLVEHWDGAAWSISNSASVGTYSVLHAVTCTSASNCWGIGEYISEDNYDQTLVERWDGSSWTIVSSPNTSAADDNDLYAVTCASTSDCWAVGRVFGASTVLVEHWDGSSWSVIGTPSINGYSNELYAASCASGSDCWVVGKTGYGASDQTLVEHWNGTSWTVESSGDNNSYIQDNYLNAVTCLSDTDCWAVGYYNKGSYSDAVSYTLTQHWDGTQWTVVPSSNTNGLLQAVSCASTNDCWAVGYVGDYIYSSRTVVLHWTGGPEWTAVNAPNVGVTYNHLNGVACVSTFDCWAVGDYSSGTYYTLIEHWNGTAWSVVTSPNNSNENHLIGVTCPSSSNCWAVGSSMYGSPKTLIEQWNGTSWAIIPSPNRGDAVQSNYLKSVTCVSGSGCWAAGYDQGSNGGHSLLEQWSGGSWAIVDSPGSPSLFGVTCSSMSDCWTVGNTYVVPGQRTLILHWNGASWATVNSPNPSPLFDYLYGTTCVSGTSCWAVGNFTSPGATQTLIEHFAPTAPTLTAVVSRKTHGSVGVFDVVLPATGSPGIEPRSGGAGGDYQMIFTFATNLTSVSSATTSAGTVSSTFIGPNPNQYTVTLTGAPNGQYLTVMLNSVQDTDGNAGDASSTMGVLIGDTNSNGSVNSADVAQTKSRVGQPVDATNFRSDLNANGGINATDAALAKSNIGTSLP